MAYRKTVEEIDQSEEEIDQSVEENDQFVEEIDLSIKENSIHKVVSKSLSTKTYEINNLKLTITFDNVSSHIYFDLTNILNHNKYFGEFGVSDIGCSMKLSDANIIINNCLTNVKGYSFDIVINPCIAILSFNALIGGFFETNFDIRLKEKIISSDEELTKSYNKMDTILNQLMKKIAIQENTINELTNTMKASNELLSSRLDKSTIYLGGSGTKYCITNGSYYQIIFDSLFVPIGATKTEVVLFSACDNTIDYSKLAHLYKLEHLVLFDNGGGYFTKKLSDLNISSQTLKCLEIKQLSSSSASVNIGFLKRCPNIKHLILYCVYGLQDLVKELKSFNHKIKQIDIEGCGQINSTEMMNYCKSESIQLNIK
jgi:hypothetical protein